MEMKNFVAALPFYHFSRHLFLVFNKVISYVNRENANDQISLQVSIIEPNLLYFNFSHKL